MTEPTPTTVTSGERQVLNRIDRGLRCPEEELRYQLERKDGHPLARAPELLDVLIDLEARGLVRSELTFALTDDGRRALEDGSPTSKT